jgi:nicotinate-nucleotide adenylyltransferase
MRVAFFGGSFDPPHLGHIAVAEAAQNALKLDRILFAPVGLQPLKPAGSQASFEDRVAMTKLAIHSHPGFEITLADAPALRSTQPNYTFDTLIALRRQFPSDSDWFLLLGADSFGTLHHWHRAVDIPFLADLIVAARPHQDLDPIDLAEPSSLLPGGLTLNREASRQSNLIHYKISGRPDNAEKQANLYILPDLNYEVSATELRNQIYKHSDSAPSLLAPEVLDYILEKHLYE